MWVWAWAWTELLAAVIAMASMDMMQRGVDPTASLNELRGCKPHVHSLPQWWADHVSMELTDICRVQTPSYMNVYRNLCKLYHWHFFTVSFEGAIGRLFFLLPNLKTIFNLQVGHRVLFKEVMCLVNIILNQTPG